jgi:hypothetical protein
MSQPSDLIMFRPSDFGTFGRFEETPVTNMPADMKDAYDFTMELRGQVPGPHKIWLANPALSKTIVPVGAYYQKRSMLTKAEIEIATNGQRPLAGRLLELRTGNDRRRRRRPAAGEGRGYDRWNADVLRRR